MKFKFALLLTFLFTLNSFSQESSKTIDNQFKSVYKNSESYLEFKLIPKKEYAAIHSNVLDSIQNYKQQTKIKNALINSQKNTIAILEKEKKETNTKLNDVLKENTSFSIFGIQLSRGAYSLTLIGIIFTLMIALGYFIFKFKNSNILTVEAKDNLIDAENELNTFRKKALEREQKLRRQLQDEIIKNRNS